MNWDERKIKGLVEINSRSIDSKFPFSEIEYIDTASANEGRLERVQKLNLAEAPSRARRIVKDNNILYSTVRPNLKHFVFIEKSKPNLIASTGFAVIECKEEIEPRFLYAFLTTNSVVDYLMSIAEGQASTFPAFNPEAIEQIKIKLPPLPVQRRIAEILGRYDALIENYAAQIRTLEASAQNLYTEWFVRGRCPFAEYETDSKLPVGWEELKFTDISSVLSGGTPKTDNPEYWNGDVYWLSPADFDGSCYILSTAKTITGTGLKNCNSKLYPIDTIVITARGTVGRVVLLGRPMAINQSN